MAKAKKKSHSRASFLVHQINAALGKSALRLGDDSYFEIIRIPSGSLTIDRITGGGFPLGRHVELYGDISACKSYVAYRTMALSQDRGNLCALIDPEHSFDAEWFGHLGGDPANLITLHPENAEDAVKSMMLLFQSGEVEVVTVDSVAALLPMEELKRDPSEEDRIAPQARMMSRALRRLTTVNQKTLVLWTNQLRTAIGNWGNPETTPGGRALRYYDSTRIIMRRGEMVKENRSVTVKGKKVTKPVIVGQWIAVRSEKEKTTRPYQQGNFVFDNELSEISVSSEIIQLGLDDDLIERTGNVFRYEDVDGKVWHGMEKSFKRQIMENEELREELIELIYDNTLTLALPRQEKVEVEEE